MVGADRRQASERRWRDGELLGEVIRVWCASTEISWLPTALRLARPSPLGASLSPSPAPHRVPLFPRAPRSTTVAAVLIGSVRKTLARTLLLVVSMGFGVVRPTLGGITARVGALVRTHHPYLTSTSTSTSTKFTRTSRAFRRTRSPNAR